jgi:putative peptidoglycan lipid II flippase
MSQDAPSDTTKTISRSSFAFLSGTFLSRLTGLGRDIAMAIAFGSNPAIAAFMVAFRFANLIRRLFGEGPLSSGFIPHFEQIRAVSSEKGAQFFRDLLFSLGLFLILLIGGIEIVLWGIWKWGNLLPDNAQILYLTILMLPGVLFICLFGLCSAFLQCERHFFLTGFAPVAFNGVWIAATLLLKGRDPSSAVLPLSLAIVVACLMQWVMLVPQTFAVLKRSLYPARGMSWRQYCMPQLFSPQLRQIVKPFLLGIIGVGAVQINSALDGVFARCASLEGPAYLWYAIRIEQLPLALFGIALSTALLPSLARALKEGVNDQYLRLLRFALRRCFSLIFPCTLGIFVLGLAGINLLYGHGDFATEDTYQTTICLWGYGLGLLPSVFVLILAPAFYAKKEFRIPMIGSVVSVGLHLLFTSLFVFNFHWGAFSIAIATSLAAWFNYFYLFYHLAKRMGEPLLDTGVFRSFLKTGSCAIVAAIATLLVGQFFVGDPTLKIVLGNREMIFSREMSMQFMQFLALGGTFVLMFLSYAWMLNAEDVLELIGVKRKVIPEGS